MKSLFLLRVNSNVLNTVDCMYSDIFIQLKMDKYVKRKRNLSLSLWKSEETKFLCTFRKGKKRRKKSDPISHHLPSRPDSRCPPRKPPWSQGEPRGTWTSLGRHSPFNVNSWYRNILKIESFSERYLSVIAKTYWLIAMHWVGRVTTIRNHLRRRRAHLGEVIAISLV